MSNPSDARASAFAHNFRKLRRTQGGWGESVRPRRPGRRKGLLDAGAPGHAGLLLLAETGDAQTHDVAGLEVDVRLLAHADPGGRAGRDHIARTQRHELAAIADQRPDAKDHRLGAAVLEALAVDL